MILFGKRIFFIIIFYIVWLQTSNAQSQTNTTNNQKTAALLQQLEMANQDSSKLKILKDLIDFNLDVQPLLAEEWIQQGIFIAQKSKDGFREIGFYLQQLRLYNQQGRFKNTLEKAKQLDKLLEKKGTPQQNVAAFTSVGNAMQRLGLYDSAAIVYNKAIVICKTHQLKDLEINALMNIGILYQYQNRITEMQLHLMNALELAKKYKLVDNIPIILVNLSNAEARLNNYGKAIAYLLEVIPFYTAKNNQYALGLVFSNLAWCYYKADQFNEALDYARKSYVIRTALNDASGIAHLDLNISKIFLGISKFDSANLYAQAALQRSKKLHLVNDIRDSYETLSRINEQIKNYPLALEYAKLFADWKDSVNNIEKNKLVEQELQKIKFDSLQHFKTVYTSLERSKNKSQTVFFILISILLVILVSGLFFYINLKKRHQELLTILPIENTNRTNHYVSKLEDEKEKIQEKNKALIQDKEELESHLKKQQSADIKNLRDLIDSDKLHTDSYWNEFLLIFSRLYPDFFKKMKSTYPDLTQHELRICALIKLNHSVLETAKVLNITVDSARKARYRLYKKMGLGNDQELVDVIIQS